MADAPLLRRLDLPHVEAALSTSAAGGRTANRQEAQPDGGAWWTGGQHPASLGGGRPRGGAVEVTVLLLTTVRVTGEGERQGNGRKRNINCS